MTKFTEDNKDTPTKTLILHPFVKNEKPALSSETLHDKLEEAKGLARAIDLKIDSASLIPLPSIKPSTYIGKGKCEELATLIEEKEITLTIINTRISPIQQRNLEKALKCKVIDRTALILEIFGERAQTKEGTLQVELAALEYQKSRLVRSWTHLERQRGGLGFVGGPGETQIEADRRIINDRIAKIKKQLNTVTRTRTLHRNSRKKIPYPIVALVGYTNAGKSTLFNTLTGANVMAKDMLFATLDPTMRLVTLPSNNQIMLSDTVGFISDLPTELIAAFRATLEEVVEADIILHVRDIAHQDTKDQKNEVISILNDIIPEKEYEDNIIEVCNKVDLLPDSHIDEKPNTLAISALKQSGISKLLAAIDTKLNKQNSAITLSIPASDGKLLSWLYENSHIKNKITEDETIHLDISISTKSLNQLRKKFPSTAI